MAHFKPNKLAVYRIPSPPIPWTRNTADFDHLDFRRDPKCWGVLVLAAMGLTHQTIANTLGIELGQVAYRLRRFNRNLPPDRRISGYNYRNGISPYSQMVIQKVGHQVKKMLIPVVNEAEAHDI